MHISFQKRHSCYIVRFSHERPISQETKKNIVLYFNKQKNIIGLDIYPPQIEGGIS